MSCPTPSVMRQLPVAACLFLLTLLSACAGRTVLAPASAPPPDAKPALATPPASMMTPRGY